MVHDAEWWRQKIESGVYIYDKDHTDFYQKKLTDEEMATSQGAIVRKD